MEKKVLLKHKEKEGSKNTIMRFCVTQQNHRLIFQQLFFREYFRLYLDAKKSDAVLFVHRITTRKVDAKMRAKIAFEHESQRLSAVHSFKRERRAREYLGFIEKKYLLKKEKES